MTWNQIKKAESDLYIKYYGDKSRMPENLKEPISDKDKKTFKELSCRNMINSCLIYGERFLESIYKNDYIKELWETRVKELYDEQLDDFKKATVYHNVYEDWEGCTYNSIKRADD